jgi:hypothetical protein
VNRRLAAEVRGSDSSQKRQHPMKILRIGGDGRNCREAILDLIQFPRFEDA